MTHTPRYPHLAAAIDRGEIIGQGLPSPGSRTPRPDRPITREDVLSVEEVAHFLSFKPRTIADWARQGKIPSRKRGRTRFFLRWEIEEWLMEHAEGDHRPGYRVTVPRGTGTGTGAPRK